MNQWHHVAASYDGSTLNLYLVSPVNKRSHIQDGNLTTSTSTNFTIGKECFKLGRSCAESTDAVDSWYDNIRIWSRALIAAEIQQDMASPIANPLNLIGSWDGTLDTNQRLKDQSANNRSGVFTGVTTTETCNVTHQCFYGNDIYCLFIIF